jgi:hypothetical protein
MLARLIGHLFASLTREAGQSSRNPQRRGLRGRFGKGHVDRLSTLAPRVHVEGGDRLARAGRAVQRARGPRTDRLGHQGLVGRGGQGDHGGIRGDRQDSLDGGHDARAAKVGAHQDHFRRCHPDIVQGLLDVSGTAHEKDTFASLELGGEGVGRIAGTVEKVNRDLVRFARHDFPSGGRGRSDKNSGLALPKCNRSHP